MEICPVVEVDGKNIGDGLPGPLTRRLQEAFKRLIPSKTEA
jgi:D-alanine transaminase